MDFEIWNYPTLDQLQLIEPPEALLESALDANTPLSEAESNPAEAAVAQAQLEQVQAIQHTTDLINQLNLSITAFLNEFNENTVNRFIQLIQTTTQAVIKKELSQDPDIIQQRIQQVLSTIPAPTTPCTIYLGKEDYELLSTQPAMSAESHLQLDSSLVKGDFKIKTPTHELVSILEQQLNELFGL